MTQRTRIYLVRHGQVEGHEQKRYNGQADVPLTDLGRRQYRALLERLEGRRIAAIYSSDLTRCAEGARILGEPSGIYPVLDKRLRELHIGDWQGRSWEEIQTASPQQWKARLNDLVEYRVPGGENLREMARRVREALAEITARHGGEEILVVGHGAVNRVVLLDAIGAPLKSLFRIEQSYGCLNIIDCFAGGMCTVQLLNG